MHTSLNATTDELGRWSAKMWSNYGLSRLSLGYPKYVKKRYQRPPPEHLQQLTYQVTMALGSQQSTVGPESS